MKTFIDNISLKEIVENPDHQFPQITDFAQVIFPWPSLLEYLDLGDLVKTLSHFDEKNILFSLFISPEDVKKEALIYLYDQIFVEFLTKIKEIPHIHQSALLKMIKQKIRTPLFDAALDLYTQKLTTDPYNTLHDLILYLAFDRVAIFIAQLFEDPNFPLERAKVLRECLIESFQHITESGKSAPSFFRLAETLYAYQMREENLQSYPEAEWLILCQSAVGLKSRESLMDVFYIDFSIRKQSDHYLPMQVLTKDKEEIIHARKQLSHYIINKLRQEVLGWDYVLSPCKILHYS